MHGETLKFTNGYVSSRIWRTVH